MQVSFFSAGARRLKLLPRCPKRPSSSWIDRQHFVKPNSRLVRALSCELQAMRVLRRPDVPRRAAARTLSQVRAGSAQPCAR